MCVRLLAVSCADESARSLQRCNSTPDLLDAQPEVTSPSGDFRSLRDAILPTKGGGGGGGSAGNLVDAVDRSLSNSRPPPPARGLSTFSTLSDQQTPVSRYAVIFCILVYLFLPRDAMHPRY